MLRIFFSIFLLLSLKLSIAQSPSNLAFLNLFQEIETTQSLSSKDLWERDWIKNPKIGTEILSIFPVEEKNSSQSEYYPLGKIKREEFYNVFYVKAGGTVDEIYLSTFTKEGKPIDQMLFASMAGNCSFQNITESVINNQNEIERKVFYEKLNCENDSLIEKRQILNENYLITKSGIIQTK